MDQKTWVISLGGSRIIPDDVDEKFLEDFKKLILTNKNHKFVVVTGGGSTARKYIKSIRELGKGAQNQSEIGIAITRFHAQFLMKLFGKPANEDLPFNMKKIKNLLAKNQVVFCGALKKRKKQTSDTTAAKIAANLKCPLINITNVDGLYTSDPKKNKNAKRIPNITWEEFNTIAQKIKFKAGQHFVLDQSAAKIIKEKKVTTYIVKSIPEIKKIINGKKCKGTVIKG